MKKFITASQLTTFGSEWLQEGMLSRRLPSADQANRDSPTYIALNSAEPPGGNMCCPSSALTTQPNLTLENNLFISSYMYLKTICTCLFHFIWSNPIFYLLISILQFQKSIEIVIFYGNLISSVNCNENSDQLSCQKLFSE